MAENSRDAVARVTDFPGDSTPPNVGEGGNVDGDESSSNATIEPMQFDQNSVEARFQLLEGDVVGMQTQLQHISAQQDRVTNSVLGNEVEINRLSKSVEDLSGLAGNLSRDMTLILSKLDSFDLAGGANVANTSQAAAAPSAAPQALSAVAEGKASASEDGDDHADDDGVDEVKGGDAVPNADPNSALVAALTAATQALVAQAQRKVDPKPYALLNWTKPWKCSGTKMMQSGTRY